MNGIPNETCKGLQMEVERLMEENGKLYKMLSKVIRTDEKDLQKLLDLFDEAEELLIDVESK